MVKCGYDNYYDNSPENPQPKTENIGQSGSEAYDYTSACHPFLKNGIGGRTDYSRGRGSAGAGGWFVVLKYALIGLTVLSGLLIVLLGLLAMFNAI